MNTFKCSLEIKRPGIFEYYYCCASQAKKKKNGFLLVYPMLSSFGGKEQLLVEDLVIQTLVPKWMGKLGKWSEFYKFARDVGYNAVHLVPIQKRGCSNSPYSIFDQLSFSEEIFDSPVSDSEGVGKISEFIRNMNTQHGVLTFTDVVWNHTACNSEWLIDHPDSGYNLDNSPHLRIAFELDQAIIKFSEHVHHYCPINEVNSTDDIDTVMHSFERFIQTVRLNEFFILDRWIENDRVEVEISKKVAIVEDGQSIDLDASALTQIVAACVLRQSSLGRFNKYLDIQKFLERIAEQIPEKVSRPGLESFLGELRKAIAAVNTPFLDEYERKLKIILDNIRTRLVYERLADHGPQLGKIGSKFSGF